MNKGHLTSIDYTDSKGIVTERSVIPTEQISNSVLTIDVSELSQYEQDKLASLWAEYDKYCEQYKKSMFSFEKWIDITTNTQPKIKWRRLTVSNIS